MEIYYINHTGQRIDFVGGSYKMLSATDLFDYKWEYGTKGSYLPRIASFSKRFVERNISIAVSARSKDEYYRLISNLLEIIERDINAVKPGRLYVNNTFLQCYFISSEKPKRYVNTQRTIVDLTLLAEDGQWVEEQVFSFGAATKQEYSGDGLDYPHDYPFDYTNSLMNQSLVNANYIPAGFIMTIYGACTNPVIAVGKNVYKVNANLITGEYVVINSEERTIYKIMNNGTKVNLFDLRDRENNIFEKIPVGTNTVSWGGAFGFDIKLLLRRSEPKWI